MGRGPQRPPFFLSPAGVGLLQLPLATGGGFCFALAGGNSYIRRGAAAGLFAALPGGGGLLRTARRGFITALAGGRFYICRPAAAWGCRAQRGGVLIAALSGS